MSNDLLVQLRSYGDFFETDLPVMDADSVVAGNPLPVLIEFRPPQPPPGKHPVRRLALAAAIVVAVVVVTVVFAVQSRDESPPVITQVSTTLTPPTPPLLSSLSWSRVPYDEAVFGGEFEQEMNSVTVGGPGLVAVGQAGPGGDAIHKRAAVWTSLDGITWDRVPHDEAVFGGAIFGGATMFSVTAGGPGLVAVGEDGDAGAAVWTSPDGINWSRVHDEAVFGESVLEGVMRSVTVGGPGLVAVGGDRSGQGATSNAVVWTSVDGITWARVPHSDAIFGRKEVNRCCTSMSSVTVGGPGLVAVGLDWPGDGEDERAAVWTSVDGIDWSRVPHDEAVFGDAWMNSVTAGGPGLVAVGADEERAVVWTSPDGIAWSRVPHDGAVFGGEEAPPACCGAGMSSVTVGGPGLVAVGSDFMRSMTLANGEWVIVAAVWTSVDGIDWSRVPHDEAVFEAPPRPELAIRSITAGGPGLVAVGANTVHDYWATHNDSGESDAAVWVAVPGE